MALLTQDSWLKRLFYDLSGALPGGPPGDAKREQLLQALREQLPGLWDMAAVDAGPFLGTGWFAGLKYKYAKLAGLNMLLAQLSTKVDGMLGRVLRLSESQKFKNLFQLRDALLKEIAALEARTRYTAPMSAAMVQTAPVMVGQVAPAPLSPTQPVPPDSGGASDANDPAYSGSPYSDSNPDAGGW
jgi:hypothetical protein